MWWYFMAAALCGMASGYAKDIDVADQKWFGIIPYIAQTIHTFL